MLPPQASVAVGAVTVAEDWPVTSGRLATLATGAVVSVTTMFCVCVAMLPWPALKVQVTTDVPWVLRVSESVVVPVMVPEQLSVAVGGASMVAEHWPVALGNVATFGTAGTVSVTTMFCVCVAMLPW